MHRGYTAERYLERLAEARARGARPRRVDRHHRRLPRRDRRRLRAHARGRRGGRVRLRLHVHLLAAAGHRGGRRWTADFVDPAVAGERFDRLRIVVERSGTAPSTRPASVASRRCSSRGRRKRNPDVLSGRTRQNKLVHFAPPHPIRTGSYATVEVTGAAPHHLDGPLRRAARRADPQAPHPRRRRGDDRAAPLLRRPCVGPTASGKSAVAMAAAAEQSRRRRDRRRRLDAGVPGHGHRHGQADRRPSERAVPHHCRPRRPDRRLHRRRVPARAYRAALADIAARGRRASSSAAPGCTTARSSTDLDLPGEWPTSGAGSRPRLDGSARRRCTRGCAELDPVAAARMEPANARRIVRALEVCEGSGRPFSSFGPGLDAYPPTAVAADRAALVPRPVLAERIERAGAPDDRRRPARRGRATRRPAGLSRTAAPGARLQGAARPPRRGGCALDEAVDQIDRAHPPVRRPPGAMVPSRPARTLGRHRARPGRRSGAGRARSTARHDTLDLTKHHGLGNDFLVVFDPRRRRPRRRSPVGCAIAAAASAPTACSSASAEPTGYAARMVLFNADGSRAEMSGNGIRCFAQALADATRRPRRRRRSSPTPATAASSCTPTERRRHDPRARVDMGAVDPLDEPDGWADARLPPRSAGRPPQPRQPAHASSVSTTSPSSTCSRSAARCRTSTSRSSSPGPSRTRSRCASTSAAPASPRPAAPAPAPARGRPRRGGSSTRVDGKSSCTWTAGVPRWRSTDPTPGPRHADRPGHLRRAPIEITDSLHEHPVQRSARRHAHRAHHPGAHRARRRHAARVDRRGRPTPASTSSRCSSTPPAPTRSPGWCSAATHPTTPGSSARARPRSCKRALPRGRRRHGRVRQRAQPGAAVQPREAARPHGDRPHRGDPRHLRPERAHARGQGAGRAGAAALPAAPPAARQRRQPVPAARRRRHPVRWRRDQARGRPPADHAPDHQARDATSQTLAAHASLQRKSRDAQRPRQRSRSSATPTPASRRCSTGSPRPACSSRTGCSPRSTRRPGGCRCPAASRCCSPTRSASSAACRTAWSRRSRARSRSPARADFLVHVVDASAADPEGQIAAVREVLGEIDAADGARAARVQQGRPRAGRGQASWSPTTPARSPISAVDRRGHRRASSRTLGDRLRALTDGRRAARSRTTAATCSPRCTARARSSRPPTSDGGVPVRARLVRRLGRPARRVRRRRLTP